MNREGWAKPLISLRKYHYFKNGKSLCLRYVCTPNEQLFDDIPESKCCATCLKMLKFPDVYRVVRLLQSKKAMKMLKVSEKYGDHLKYPLKRHVLHLLDEVAEFILAYLDNDKEKMIEELTDISNMCDLTYDKIRQETTEND